MDDICGHAKGSCMTWILGTCAACVVYLRPLPSTHDGTQHPVTYLPTCMRAPLPCRQDGGGLYWDVPMRAGAHMLGCLVHRGEEKAAGKHEREHGVPLPPPSGPCPPSTAVGCHRQWKPVVYLLRSWQHTCIDPDHTSGPRSWQQTCMDPGNTPPHL